MYHSTCIGKYPTPEACRLTARAALVGAAASTQRLLTVLELKKQLMKQDTNQMLAEPSAVSVRLCPTSSSFGTYMKY
ncbi:hypothetical protein INR49_003198 [Caranx melampygus]|nr:hypothetical protein INR49_003198 [Caranx melampygus]